MKHLVILAGIFGVCVLAGNLVGGTYPPGPTVSIPLYGAGLAQPQPAGGSLEERLNRLEERLVRMETKLDQLLKLIEEATVDEKPGGQPQPPQPPANRQALLISGATKCASCHFPDVAEQKGGGFRLFTAAGAFAPLTARQKQQVLKRLSTDDPSFAMPPPASSVKLTPEERAALVAEFDSPPPK